MPQFKAPLRDIRFLVHDVYGFAKHYAENGHDEIDNDLIDPVLEEAARFCENVLDGTRVEGDDVGSKLVDGNVITPPSYKKAASAIRDGQWIGICSNPEFGGQGLPHSLGLIFHDLAESANQPLCAIFTLAQGSMRAIEAHASEQLKQTWLPKMVSGEWTGSMCLTESHAGSDLGLLRTRAEPLADDRYAISGEKIFITWGDHDLAENVVHLVLARLPDAPKGPKGISLFLVPKFLLATNGSLGERNAVTTAKLEEKMGLKSSPTCVLNFDGATGWLVGAPHNGLAAMFTMMNSARLDVAFEGVGLGQLSYQGAVEYARERLQMRAVEGARFPEQSADPIIVHPDVRRMLMTQKSLVEGCRALGYFTAMQLDIALGKDAAKAKDANDLVALLTPICKGFFTERGSEVTDLGVQCLGGHGYIREHGMEQLQRDVRITRIYEGTNGIQAIDLMRRKVIGSDRRLLNALLAVMADFFAANRSHRQGVLVKRAEKAANDWSALTDTILARSSDEANLPMSAAFEYMEYAGYVCLAWCWAKMAVTAADAMEKEGADKAFLQAKIDTALFYMDRILPRTLGLEVSMLADTKSLLALDDEQMFMP
ncbi:MAG: acyl-CoA dehydrogenase C-terminal domain-containing protein [Gammaproteobacteria bacterium]|jgi:alkylation response protein AidB-like acyl-CoA dehydrogenase|nr:acyl-CoA dehydrogenase C-terminal domain-containing protein [Gammaproteobacteria bacterium]MBQ0774045.1 acyl-CoA dehydrogenase C-terminal domain-containing protein [Gammaproteobacteria bacterium]